MDNFIIIRSFITISVIRVYNFVDVHVRMI